MVNAGMGCGMGVGGWGVGVEVGGPGGDLERPKIEFLKGRNKGT